MVAESKRQNYASPTGGFFIAKMDDLSEIIQIKPFARPVDKTVKIPGSKSITNRALLLAALTKKPVTIKNPLISDDTIAMINALRVLGVEIKQRETEIEVVGNIFSAGVDRYRINADLSGTTIRFLLPALTVVPGIKIISGKESLNNRPIKDLVESLTKMGAVIEYLERPGFPPLIITSCGLSKNKTMVHGATSSQYVSSILMSLPLINGGKIAVRGNLVSKSYVDLTIDIMKSFGVEVVNHDYKLFEVKPGQEYTADSYAVEGDYSSASYFAAIAALTSSKMTLENLNPASLQGDLEFIYALKKMGTTISLEDGKVIVKGTGVTPIEVNMENCPDQIQTMAVLAAFADGKSTISGISTLAVKETNRLSAIRRELKKMGVKTEVTRGTLIVHGQTPYGAEIDTYQDHRMAMSFAVAGAKIPGMSIKNPEVVTKTFPEFWRKLESINVKIENTY